MKSIRLAVSSDWHITDTAQFSEFDQTGRPDRLLKFIRLAMDFSEFAVENKADAMIITGDLLDSAILRPMVVDVSRKVFEILSSSGIPTVVIYGNHDIDTKTSEVAKYHSALSHLLDVKNILYVDNPMEIAIQDYKIYACPWLNRVIDFLPADIFLGHGLVQGSQNWEGYKFSSGFDPKMLSKKYKLSVIGDIHNGQVLESNILIPGCPIQRDYKDSPTTGFWLTKIWSQSEGTRSESTVDLTFKSIHDIRPDFYHRFLITNDPHQKSSNLDHYRYKAPRAQVPHSVGIKTIRQASSLKDTAFRLIDEAKIENKDIIKASFIEALENIVASDRKIPRSKIHQVKIYNFLSIGEFELSFKEIEDNLVIMGPTGAGKTSIFEAIFWCLTGSTTKTISVSDIINDYSTNNLVHVSLLVEVEDTLYQITRERYSGKPFLHVGIWSGEWVSFDRGSTASTQGQIYTLLGLGQSEILLLSYFPAKSPVLFGTLGSSDKNSLMATIGGQSEVDTIKDFIGKKLSDTEKDLQTHSGSRIAYLGNIHSSTIIVKDLVEQQSKSSWNQELKSLIEEEVTLNKQLQEFSENDIEMTKLHDAVRSKLHSAQINAKNVLSELGILEDNRERIRSRIQILRLNLETAHKGVCPTCGASLYDKSVVQELTSEIANMEKNFPTDSEIKEYQEILTEINSKIQALSIEESKLRNDRDKYKILDNKLKVVREKIPKVSEPFNFDEKINWETARIEGFKTELVKIDSKIAGLTVRVNSDKWLHGNLLKRNGPLIQELNKTTKVLLQDQVDILTNGEDFSVHIDDQLNITAKFFGRDAKGYGGLSNGQERVVDLVMMVALNNLFTQIYGLEEGVLGILVFDEVMSFLDPKYIDFSYSLLERVNVSKRIIITHDDRLISRFNQKITVSLDPGRSSSQYSKNW
jgi:hypothetical protein